MLKISFLSIVIAVVCVVCAGCADMDAPTPEKIITNPIGTGSVKIGMMKSQVLDIYGDPDTKQFVESDEWGDPREEWFYSGRYSALPVSAGYLSKDLYFYFDGDSLTNISGKPLGKSKSEKIEDVEKSIK